MATISPELDTGILAQPEEQQQDTEAAFALMALDAELDARHQTAADESKRRLEEHMDAARNWTGGRGYEFGRVVDRGHATRVLGGSTVSEAFGMAPRPLGMPFMGTRNRYGNPYINRSAVRY